MRGALRAAGIALALAVVLAPFLFLFLNGFKPSEEFALRPPRLLPSHVTLEHYAVVFDPEGDTFRYLRNSLVVTGCATALAVTLGTAAAYGLNRLRLPFRLDLAIAFAFLVVRFYPKITVALPYFILMRQLHLLDTQIAVILAHASLTLPFVVWLVLGFLQELPKELEEQAMIDGCSLWQRFRLVVLPLSGPVIVTAAVLTAILSWNEFLMASAVAPNVAKTLPVRIASFITDKGIQWGPMSAMGTVIVAPVMLFALVMQRWLVRGLTMGAVKE
jgi:multiple sugar transport system permease protein